MSNCNKLIHNATIPQYHNVSSNGTTPKNIDGLPNHCVGVLGDAESPVNEYHTVNMDSQVESKTDASFDSIVHTKAIT